MARKPELRLIPGFPGYAVSSDGFVWSRWKRGPGGLGQVWRVVAGGTDKDGYKKVILCRDGERHHFRVHILVLICFVGPCPAEQESRHRNGVRDDNRRSNLRWSTHKANVADKKKHGTWQGGSRNGNASTTESVVQQVKRRLAAGDKPAAISQRLDVSRGVVNNIKYGGAWAHVKV